MNKCTTNPYPYYEKYEKQYNAYCTRIAYFFIIIQSHFISINISATLFN